MYVLQYQCILCCVVLPSADVKSACSFLLQRKKVSPDSTPSSNEPSSRGTSPLPKRLRLSTVKVREAPDRSTMTMQELIYYNPSANPMRYTYRVLPTLVGGGRPQPPLSHFYHHSSSFYHHSQVQKNIKMLQQTHFFLLHSG